MIFVIEEIEVVQTKKGLFEPRVKRDSIFKRNTAPIFRQMCIVNTMTI